MKIVHILYSGLGGHGNVFFSMVSSDVAKEFEFEAIFCGVEDIRKEYVERCSQYNIPYTFIKKHPGAHYSFYRNISKAIRSANPQIVFLHGSVNLPALLRTQIFLRKKRRIIVRETQAIHLKTFTEKIALKLSLLFANKIVFLSEEYRNEVAQAERFLYKPAKIKVIPNGIDLNVFSPAKVPHNTENSFVLGMQSRLVAIKDHLTLFEALNIIRKQHPELQLKLRIAGDGEYRSTLEQEVTELGLRGHVHFTGMLNEADLPLFLQPLDIYIHASLGETMSTAIMQSMACGLPVIASDVDGINNMIENGQTGMLVPVKQAAPLANAILELIMNPLERARLAENGRKHAERYFSNQRMFADYKQLFLNKTS